VEEVVVVVVAGSGRQCVCSCWTHAMLTPLSPATTDSASPTASASTAAASASASVGTATGDCLLW
jgi:hypothetical protein